MVTCFHSTAGVRGQLSASAHKAVAHPHSSGAPAHACSRARMPPPHYATAAALRTWNEHMSVSSTLIMAPAFSNSPQ